jgi:hypothetical protein
MLALQPGQWGDCQGKLRALPVVSALPFPTSPLDHITLHLAFSCGLRVFHDLEALSAKSTETSFDTTNLLDSCIPSLALHAEHALSYGVVRIGELGCAYFSLDQVLKFKRERL